MSTDERITALKKALDSLLRYDGPKSYIGRLPADVDEDIWCEVMILQHMLEARINELEVA